MSSILHGKSSITFVLVLTNKFLNRVYEIIRVIKNIWKHVTIQSLLSKQFHVFLVNATTRRPDKLIPLVFVCCFIERIDVMHWYECWIVDSVAKTIKSCIEKMDDVSDIHARYYCGYTLMKHCAGNVGLDRFPLNFPLRRLVDE